MARGRRHWVWDANMRKKPGASAAPPAKPSATPGPAARAAPAPARRRKLFIALALLLVFVVQEALFRFVFPLPEVAGFNRIRYTQLQLFSDAVAQTPKSAV